MTIEKDEKAGLPYLGLEVPIFTEDVELPSEGRFYPKDSPLRDVTHIEMKHPGTKEQDILMNRTLLRKGLALDVMVTGLIVDPMIKRNYDNLLISDRSALAAAARILMHSEYYEGKAVCQSCENKQPIVVNLLEIESYKAQIDLKELGVRTEEEVGGTVFYTSITLPDKRSVEIGFKLLTGKDENQIFKSSERKKKLKQPETPTGDQLKQCIVSVEGNRDRNAIWGFVETVPVRSVSKVLKVYRKVAPAYKIISEFECEACGHMDQKYEVAVGASFFWPK